MKIPRLEKSNRVREYNLYSSAQHTAVVKAYLFNAMTHRQIDFEVLGLDSNSSKGFQSMGILHYLGLNDPFKGIFRGMTIPEAVKELRATNDLSYIDLISILIDHEINENQCEEDIHLEISSEYMIQKEGQKKQVYTTRYERNPYLRKMAIQIHGTTCMACGFNYQKVYGERGKNYIEVHHIVPLANIEDEIEVNPDSDLIVVCANCHRMIHRRKNDILTLNELKELIKTQ